MFTVTINNGERQFQLIVAIKLLHTIYEYSDIQSNGQLFF